MKKITQYLRARLLIWCAPRISENENPQIVNSNLNENPSKFEFSQNFKFQSSNRNSKPPNLQNPQIIKTPNIEIPFHAQIQKKKASKFVLAPIDASREILRSAYLLLSMTLSDSLVLNFCFLGLIWFVFEQQLRILNIRIRI